MPTDLTTIPPETRTKILTHIKTGVAVDSAFILYGFTPSQKAACISASPRFGVEVDQAVVYYRHILLNKIEKAAEGDWRAATWLLEHHIDHKDVFAPTVKTSQTVQVVLSYDYAAPRQGMGITIDMPKVSQPSLVDDS